MTALQNTYSGTVEKLLKNNYDEVHFFEKLKSLVLEISWRQTPFKKYCKIP